MSEPRKFTLYAHHSDPTNLTFVGEGHNPDDVGLPVIEYSAYQRIEKALTKARHGLWLFRTCTTPPPAKDLFAGNIYAEACKIEKEIESILKWEG